MTLFMQITLAALIGSAALLAAATTPNCRPLTDDARTRIVLSMAVTLMVMCCPVCAAGAVYSVVMFVVGSMFMFGTIKVVLGATPYRRLSPGLIEARKPRGYSWVPSLMVRRVGVMA